MINEEFNIYLNIDEDIIFERKTHKTLREYAYEALEIIGKPSHIDQINEQIKILKPDYENDITNTSLKREYGFVPFGRKSVFGLKKWDSEEGKVKGGTIRSIAEEFLTNYPQPMNIKDIANYVLQFRPESNEKSIIYNLKMEDNNRFTFFKNSFIGLKSKQYNDNKYSLLDSNEKMIIRSWEENYQELLNFISINNKLPSSMTCPLEEKRISRWLYTQKSKINRGLLDNSRAQLIIEITSNFNLRDNKTTLFRSDGYKKLIEFIEQEKRLPSANKNAESQLYAFFYKQRKLYEDSKLNADELSKFIQIAKLIQNIKK
ncbi:Helicase associated domain protein [compost metagenome]